MGWADFGPIFDWGSNGFPASGPAARRLRHRGATRRLGVAARTPARRRLVGSWAPRARPRPRPSTGVISTAVRSRAQGRRRGVSQAARGGGGARDNTCTHQHGAARTETRGHRPPQSTCPLLLCRSGPRTCPWCRRGDAAGQGEKGGKGPAGVRLRADLPGCCGVERRQLNGGGGGSGSGSVAGKPSPLSFICNGGSPKTTRARAPPRPTDARPPASRHAHCTP